MAVIGGDGREKFNAHYLHRVSNYINRLEVLLLHETDETI